MTIVDWFFILTAAVTLVGAYRVVVSEKIMHAALWLGLTFAGVAAIFFLLGADFLAAAQLLIYVGAITTIIIFGIMLSAPEDLRGKSGQSVWQRVSSQFSSPRHGVFALVAAGGLALTLFVMIIRSAWPSAGPIPPEALDTPRLLGEALFVRFVIPFEIASAVLLAALIGAIALATKDGDAKGEEQSK